MNDEVRQTDLRDRTKQFAIRIIKLCAALPSTQVARVIGNQLLRSGTSVGAQYREAHRARSTAEFVSKLNCVLQELEESSYWIELLIDAEIMKPERMRLLAKEADELTAIFVASCRTAKRSQRR